MTKERAIEIIKHILNDLQNGKQWRRYFDCDDYAFYTQSIKDEELIELGFPVPDREG